MADPYIGEIRIFPYSYAPEGWLLCDGSLYAIQQYTALFAVVSTQFGGNGTSNFGVPNLSGRAPIGFGQGPGLTGYVMGEAVGQPQVTLTSAELPAHTHSLSATLVDDTTATQTFELASPAGAKLSFLYTRPNSTTHYALVAGFEDTANATMGATALTSLGGSGAHSNQQPFLAFRFCIASMGVYPIRP